MDEFRALLSTRMRARGAQARLAELSGIPSPVLGRWRSGEGRPTDTNLRKLAPALGEPYEKLAKMCGYLPGDSNVPETDPIDSFIQRRTVEMREAVRDTPQEFWATIINATFDRGIEDARRVKAMLLDLFNAENTTTPATHNKRVAATRITRPGPTDPQIHAYQLSVAAGALATA